MLHRINSSCYELWRYLLSVYVSLFFRYFAQPKFYDGTLAAVYKFVCFSVTLFSLSPIMTLWLQCISLFFSYFVQPKSYDGTLAAEEANMEGDSGKLIMAVNGWVMGDNPLRNFADPGWYYHKFFLHLSVIFVLEFALNHLNSFSYFLWTLIKLLSVIYVIHRQVCLPAARVAPLGRQL
mgnify:CR=1 FL=1